MHFIRDSTFKKSLENSFFQQDIQGKFPEEVAVKMAAAQGYSGVIFLRGDHLGCRFLRKGPRTCQGAFNVENKNNCKGKMFWLSRSAAGFSGMLFKNWKRIRT